LDRPAGYSTCYSALPLKAGRSASKNWTPIGVVSLYLPSRPPTDSGRAGPHNLRCIPSPHRGCQFVKIFRSKIKWAAPTPPAPSAVRPQSSNDDSRGQEPVQARSRFASLPTGAGPLLVGGAVRLLPIRSSVTIRDFIERRPWRTS